MSDQQIQTEGLGSAVAVEGGDFASLLQKEFKPKSEEARDEVSRAVQTLAQQALSQTQLINADVVKSIEAIIAELDHKLSEQINLIMHHEDFQQLEGAWRGLHYLVNNTETDETLKVRVMNISKGELGKTLKRFKGTAWDQSPLFKKVYEEEYGQFGGEPFGCIVGDYYFDHSPQDVGLLAEMAKISASAHTPFIAGVSPTVMQMDTWQELANPRDLTKIFSTPEYAAWRSLRESDDARYIGVSRKSGKVLTLKGRTLHTLGADGVTPSRFLGYEFRNGNTVYRVSQEGVLDVRQGEKVVVSEKGKWAE